MNSKPTVLITGVAGLFGANFSRHLLKNDYKVVGIDDLSGGYKEFLPSVKDFTFFPYKLGELCLDDIIAEFGVQYVYHFAAYAAAGLSPFIREFNYENNVLESARLINACIRSSSLIKKFVFTSSMETFGDNPNPPYKEEDIDRYPPHTPYGIAKRAIELDLESAYQYHQLDYAIVRPHNVAGVYQNIWDRYRNVIGIFIRQAIAREPLTVYGDGQQKRAFSDIQYYMEPLEKLILDPSLSRKNGATNNLPIWNIGADKEYSILDIAHMVQKHSESKLGYTPEIQMCEERKEVRNAWCDHSKAKKELDFVDNTNIDSLVKEMFSWARNVKPKAVKSIKYETTKNMKSFWK